MGVFEHAGGVGNVPDIVWPQVEPAVNFAETVRTQDAPEFAQALRDAAHTYVDTFDYEGGPELQGVFLRKGTPGPKPPRSNQVIANGAGSVACGRDKIGVQINKGRR